ncbi:unnamed protein product [Dibothriocephalus latus]|uniref:Mediator of RNA polymerase II transcription subunit 4 n=1 Tax=Dibothriocephalus latus TaxID=60516 RepID=A0A3P7LH75_DIBLA|nr:unnamed protein product [Dibothriocephalus latus]
MSTGVSTKERLLSHFESIDGILKDILDRVTKKAKFVEYEHLVRLLLDKDSEIKRTLKDAEEQLEIQKKIDKLRADCVNSDAQIELCQKELKKSELLLSTALYYCRQKLDCMVNSIKNPIDLDELIQFSHWISFNYGVMAPDNWVQGDPRRPYPNKKEIRRGYLGHLDDSGHFRPSVNEEFAQAFPSSTNTPPSFEP